MCRFSPIEWKNVILYGEIKIDPAKLKRRSRGRCFGTGLLLWAMRPRVFESRHTATKAARRLRPQAPDRLVLACETCPATLPSRRRPPAWGRIAEAGP